jgi:REP element-mobilizing transposase RayT
LKEFVAEQIYEIEEHHPDVEIERFSIKNDHVHLVIIIPPKYSVSDIVEKTKANTSREERSLMPSPQRGTATRPSTDGWEGHRCRTSFTDSATLARLPVLSC